MLFLQNTSQSKKDIIEWAKKRDEWKVDFGTKPLLKKHQKIQAASRVFWGFQKEIWLYESKF